MEAGEVWNKAKAATQEVAKTMEESTQLQQQYAANLGKLQVCVCVCVCVCVGTGQLYDVAGCWGCNSLRM